MSKPVHLTGSGVELWFGGDDTPVPPEPPDTTSQPQFTVAVAGSRAGDRLFVRYFADGHEAQIELRRIGSEGSVIKGRVVKLFEGSLKGLRHGVEVQYAIVFERKTHRGVFRLPDDDSEHLYPYRFIFTAKGTGRATTHLKAPSRPQSSAQHPVQRKETSSLTAECEGLHPETMSFDTAQEALGRCLKARQRMERKIRELRARIKSLEGRGQGLGRKKRPIFDAEERNDVLAEIRSELVEREKALSKVDNMLERLRRRLDELTPAVDEPLPGISDRYPILLFPMRLEARFMGDATYPQLWVRIYPDQLCIESHQPELTRPEVEDGRLYAERLETAGKLPREEGEDDISLDERRELARRQAWRALASRFGPRRAAWIAKQVDEYRAKNSTDSGDGPFRMLYDDRDLESLSPESTPQTPRAYVMPDNFVVRCYQDGECIAESDLGKRIQDPLPMLFDICQSRPGRELFDPASRWLVDFDAAIAAGMAVKIDLKHLTAEQLQKGFDRVIAVGVNTDKGEAQEPQENGAQSLERFIDSHHYTDGIAFLPYDTPTNNTGTTPSGYSQYARDYEESYSVERAMGVLPEDCDARKLAQSFGIDNISFASVANAGNVETFEDMLRALWPATWGLYCGGLGLAKSDCLNEVREHYAKYVRPRGFLPSFRIGNQPYGILPVSKIKHWQADGSEHPIDTMAGIPFASRPTLIPRAISSMKSKVSVEGSIYEVLLKLFDLFLGMANDPEAVPRVGETEDPDAELLRILAMEASPVTYGERLTVLDVFIEQLLWFTAPVFFGTNSVFAASVNSHSAYEWAEQWIASWQEQLSSNADLLHEVAGIDVNADVSDLSPFLLRLIHWNSVLAGKDDWANENGSITLQGEDKPWEVGGLLATFVRAALDADSSVGSKLIKLSKRPIGVNESHFRDALSLSTHRLDAWFSSFPNRRLDDMRTDNPRGIFIGAYGWGENLKPGDTYIRQQSSIKEGIPSSLAGIDGVNLTKTRLEETAGEGEGRSGTKPRESQSATPDRPIPGGYIHAPSIPQATAAAVLRSAYITRAEEGIPEAAKVNLSSERVRLALRLINGIREGQQLGALLGYQFERGLHDCYRDQYIDVFREHFPLVAGKETELQEGESAETVAARNVVDGLQLATAWREAESPALKTLSDELPETDEAIVAELNRLTSSLDAVSDLWFTEAIFQGTQGRYEAMGAAIDAADGVGPVPEVECVRTPRSGLSHSHRVCVAFTKARNQSPRYLIDSRQAAEPELDRWAYKILGNPAEITCYALVAGEDEPRIVSLEDLEISSLDFVYMSATPPSGEDTELEQLIRYMVRMGGSEPLDASIEVTLDLDPVGEGRTFAQALEVAHSLLQVIANSTPLRPAMLCLPEDENIEWSSSGDETQEVIPPPIGVYVQQDCDDLLERVTAALKTLAGPSDPSDDEATSILDDLLNSSNNDAKCAALDRARLFGLPDAVPASTVGDELLDSRIETVAAEIQKRKKKARILIDGKREQIDAIAKLPISERRFDNVIKELISALKALFGASFPVLPTFHAPEAEELRQALGADILGGHGTERIWLWLQQAAHTHPSLRKFETALMMGEAWQDAALSVDVQCEQDAAVAISVEQGFDLQIVQLPYKECDRWIALENDTNDNQSLQDRPQGCLSLAIHAPEQLIFTGAGRVLSGILIDQWDESIPSKEEVTAVAFNYDQPSQQAPQSLLLAVPGEWGDEPKEWCLEDVFEIVSDTMDLMKVRTVDLDALRHVGQFLPALYLIKRFQQLDPTGQAGAMPVNVAGGG